ASCERLDAFEAHHRAGHIQGGGSQGRETLIPSAVARRPPTTQASGEPAFGIQVRATAGAGSLDAGKRTRRSATTRPARGRKRLRPPATSTTRTPHAANPAGVG